jgi:hypothetical protein
MFNEKDIIEILELNHYELLSYINDLPHDGYEKIVNLPYYICFFPKKCLVAPLVCAHIDIANKKYPTSADIDFSEGILSLKEEAEKRRKAKEREKKEKEKKEKGTSFGGSVFKEFDYSKLSDPDFQEDLSKYSYTYGSGKILGGDDRCGVVVLLEALKNKIPYIITFFNFEEPNNGAGKGSRQFGKDHMDILIKSSMFIGMDWIREQEFAVYNYASAKCSRVLREELKLKEMENIAFTDCAILSTFAQKPAIAISVGYFNQHSSNEYIVVAETQQAYRNLERLYKEFYKDFWVVLDDIESLNSYMAKFRHVIKATGWH